VLQAGNTITGDVTVERFIPTSTVHGKSWQLLAIPTTGGQTIHQSWQENCGVNLDCHSGYGTQITGTGTGFDAAGATPSMKTYDYTISDYRGVTGTDIQIYNKKGYFVFVRGDRSVTQVTSPPKVTTLRTTGPLYTAAPGHLPLPTTVAPNSFETVGNPYASAIDVRKIGRTNDVTEFVQVWDPKLGGVYGYGGFQTFIKMNASDYTVSPGGYSYPAFGVPYNYIQSGQAFVVQTSTGGTLGGNVTFDESAKVKGSTLVTAPNPAPVSLPAMLNTTLMEVTATGSTNILDGAIAMFGDSYSNAVDGLDARKSANTSENLSIKTAGKLLSVERRHTLTAQDTIFLNLTTVRVQKYRFHFEANDLNPALQGYLEDSYLKSRTPLNMAGGTDVTFDMVNIPGAYVSNRFRIVFAPLEALPVTFTSLKAYQQDKNINVEWRVDNERNMKQYEVEKSTDGSSFTTIAVKAAAANNGGSAVYTFADTKPAEGYNYYRIHSIDMNGKATYTNVVKVLVGNIKQEITIYPNPVTDGMIHLQLVNQPQGKYLLRLLNKLGQTIVQKQVTHAGGNSTQLLKWDYNLAHGMYQLEVTRPDGSVKDLNVMY
jgi:hypothetical protein